MDKYKYSIGIDARMLGSRHGGIGRYVFELLKAMLPKAPELLFVLFYNKESGYSEEIEFLKSFPNVKLVAANSRHYSVMEQTKFLWKLNKENLDLVHFPNFNVPLYYRKPFVVTIHDMVHHKISGAKKSRFMHFMAYKKVMENAGFKAQRIITVSNASKADIVNLLQVPESKVEVVYEGPSLNPKVEERRVINTKKNFLLTRPYLLFVGVLERKKNIVNLTRGFDEFLRKYKLDVDLVIAGKADPHYPDIKYKALDIKHKDHVVFTGYVEDSELEALYAGAAAFVTASLHEGFGLPGVEAMQFGLPLLASNTQVFNEVYDNAAIYFDPENITDIAEKINLLANDQQFHAQQQEKSWKRGMLFLWDKAAEETLSIYLSVLKSHS